MYTVYINHSERWSSLSGSFTTKKGGNHRDLRRGTSGPNDLQKDQHEAKQIFVESYHIIATGKKKPEVENYYKLKSEVYNFQVRLSHLLFLESLLGLQC